MKLTIVATAVAATLAGAHTAQAREHYHRHAHHPRYAVAYHEQDTWRQGWHHGWDHGRVYDDASAGYDQGDSRQWSADTYTENAATDNAAGTRRGGRDGRPSAWCGWQMRRLVGGDPGPQFNLARNWAHWGHGGPAGVGAVVVWPHHVGKIVGQEGGMWVIESGNDGHRLRTRPRSIAGAIAFRWS
jgi:hypothetical protein